MNRVKTISITLLLILGMLSCQQQQEILFDGYYQANIDGEVHSVRFFEDGTVVQLAEPFNQYLHQIPKEKEKAKKEVEDGILSGGSYQINGEKIDFVTKSGSVNVSFEGTILENNKLNLNIHSLANGYQTEGDFIYVPY